VENLWITWGSFPQGIYTLWITWGLFPQVFHSFPKFSTSFPQVFHRLARRELEKFTKLNALLLEDPLDWEAVASGGIPSRLGATWRGLARGFLGKQELAW
jgi:hypothetical protein